MITKKLKLLLSEHWINITAFLLALALIVCSVTVAADTFTDPQTYWETIRSIDEKKVTVLAVSAAIAGSATLLASVPDDSTTPLAEEMMDLSSYLVIVVCILVLEKSFLTVFGAISCYALFPVACFLAFLFVVNRKKACLSWAIKLAVLALALLAIVPTAMKLSDYIYEVNQVSVEQKIESTEDPNKNESNKDLPWYEKLWGTITDAVQNTVDAALDKGKKALNNFIDAVSVFIIAYCAIPIFIVIFFLWLLKILFGLTININIDAINPRQLRKKRKQAEVERLP